MMRRGDGGEGVVVWFDGVCVLCNGFVDFLLKRDRRGRIRFGALQSPAGESVRQRARSLFGEVDSIVVSDGDALLVRSNAALRAIAALGGRWRMVGILRLVPRPVRDAVYDAVARRRYRWFGRREACRAAAVGERNRFVDTGLDSGEKKS
jgi:predicted DCC family thiol-disulfide oxidoreductase YuxK